MNIKKQILCAAAAVAITAGITSPAFAATQATLSTAQRAHIMKLADQELARRLTIMDALSPQVTEMINLPAEDKTALLSSIQGIITELKGRSNDINTGAMTEVPSTLKDDVDSINTTLYRPFVLVFPQATIEVAADRELTIIGILNDLGTKFASRIQSATSTEKGIAAASTTLADYNAKLSDAATQVNAAVAEVVPLIPDEGSSTIAASNTMALKDAHTKLLAAQQDFVGTQTDAKAIIKDLGVNTSIATTTTTTNSITPIPTTGNSVRNIIEEDHARSAQ